MLEVLQNSLVQTGLWLIALTAASVLGFRYVKKWRDDDGEDVLDRAKLLEKFREMHLQGILSPEEYRTIKAKLSEQTSDKASGQVA